jgi:hypothetical protein
MPTYGQKYPWGLLHTFQKLYGLAVYCKIPQIRETDFTSMAPHEIGTYVFGTIR